MTVAVEIAFPWGRYHSTPWMRAANEGIPEWPPSPWRLLRALYATWRERAPDLTAGTVEGLLDSLAQQPPRFWLPPSTVGHSRHYFPDTKHGTDLVFDPFVVLPFNGAVGIEWDVQLVDDRRSALERLLAALPHLGRAESICDGRLVGGIEPRGRAEVVPTVAETAMRGAVSWVLAAQPPLDLAGLTMTTTALRRQRRALPPGSAEIPYTVPERMRRPVPTRRPELPKPRLMQLAIDGPVLPARTAAVAMAEALRAACQSRFGTRTDTSPTLSGKAPDGSLLGDHRHAHYLAMDHDDDGRIDHLAVWAPYGLEPAEVAAVAKVDRLEGAQFEQARDFARVRVAIESVASDPLQLGHIAGPAAVWRSHTPFAPSLHPKKQSQAAFLTEAVQRELDWRSSHWSRPPLLEAVEPIEPERGAWVTYRRRRVREAARRNRRAGGLQLTFREPVMGPLALGQLSHFGLGLFTPVR